MLHLQKYLEKKYITQIQLDVAYKISSTSKHNIDDILLACGFVTSKEVAIIKSERLNISYVDLKKFIPHEEALSLLERKKAIELTVLPLMISSDKLVISIDERNDFKHKEYLERITGKEVQFVISSKKEILNHLMTHEYFTQDDETLQKINELKKRSEQNIDIVNLVDLLIEDAIEDSASDIHISPEKDIVNVFFRIDGVLKHYHTLPKEFQERIISRIKILAKLDISQTSLPQDGQIEYIHLHSNFRLRVSTIATSYGENIVMRLLKNSVSDLSIDSLGLLKKNKILLKKLFKQPNGLILVTGPTGSGKTTTLYSALKEINSLRKNILTVEDPIEYQIPFIKQTQINVKVGYTFDNALRAFMRQDPDVILVGEIRDEETAALALRASITGHLVLSTLHTNDAVGAIGRLVDLGIAEYLVGSATIAILAQRLVRKLCPHCKEKVKDTQKELTKYDIPNELINSTENLQIYEAKGCDKCSQTGYNSRVMILEILQVDKQVEEMISNKKSSLNILNYVKSKGMRSMLDDGYKKVLEGITSFEEIQRTVQDREFLEG